MVARTLKLPPFVTPRNIPQIDKLQKCLQIDNYIMLAPFANFHIGLRKNMKTLKDINLYKFIIRNGN
jgi:hypothetical protein